MTLRALQPVKFEPVWAEYEMWGWEKQSEWASNNMRSDSRRRAYILEQDEFNKEKRIAELTARALRTEIETVIREVIASGVLRGK